MTTATHLLQHFIALFEEWLPDSGDGEADLRQLIEHLNDAGKQRIVKGSALPVVEIWLEQCCAQPSPRRYQLLLDALLENSSNLGWFTPNPEYAGEQMAQNYAFVRLVGPQLFGEDNAPFYSDKIAAGFTIQAPHVYYPSHRHPAVEFYGTLTGTGLWQIDDGPFVEKPLGTMIYHPSNAPHAMQTTNEPMLTAYAWVGDILTRPVVENEQIA